MKVSSFGFPLLPCPPATAYDPNGRTDMRRSVLTARQTYVQLRRYATSTTKPSVDKEEVAKFDAQAAKWWDPNGPAAPLHRMNPVRLAYIRSVLEKHILSKRADTPQSLRPFSGIDVVDVGCGGGLVTEPMARLGANVLGIDMSKEGIHVAQRHAQKDSYLVSSANLRYKKASVEDLSSESDQFDVVMALEIIEHVAEPNNFLQNCASLVREGGVLILSTLNRTVASYALGIVAAERILGLLPPGTHQWSKFPRPEEVAHVLTTETSLVPDQVVGLRYWPLSGTFSIVQDTSVNYILSATKPLSSPTTQEEQAPKKNEGAPNKNEG